MSPTLWITALGIAGTVLVTVTTWGFLTGKFSGGVEEKARKLSDDLREYKIEIERRFAEANHETSRAWSYVQGIETRLLRECANRDLMETKLAEHRRNVDRLRLEMDAFKVTCNGRHLR